MRPGPPTPLVGALLLAVILMMMTAAVTADAAPLPGSAPPESPATGSPAPVSAPPGPALPDPYVRGGAVRPVPGVVVRPFDPPAGPYGPGHRGVDLAAQHGDPVLAALAGTVVFSGRVAGVGWVTVDHGGDLVTTYGPLRDRRATGTPVAAGQVIGVLDRPGQPPPVHLDWGARLDGSYIDPVLLLARWQLRLTAVGRCPDGKDAC